MNLENSFRQALLFCQSKGIKISFGAMFDWRNDDLPFAVDAMGAILVQQNKHQEFKLDFPPGWLVSFCNEMQVSPSWIHNFSMGFNHGFQIMIENYKGGKLISLCPDEASKMGLVLRKEFK